MHEVRYNNSYIPVFIREQNMNRKFAVVIVSVFIVLNAFFSFFKPFSPAIQSMAGSLFSVFASLLAVIGAATALSRFKIFDRTKKAWLFLFIGILLFFIAESTYTFCDIFLKINMEATVPSIADPIYMLAYFPIMFGLCIFIFGYLKSGLPLGDIRQMILSNMIFLGCAELIIIKVIVPLWQNAEIAFSAKIVRLFYPIADMLILLLLVI